MDKLYIIYCYVHCKGNKAYWVVMIDREGVEHRMKALGIDRITSDIEAV